MWFIEHFWLLTVAIAFANGLYLRHLARSRHVKVTPDVDQIDLFVRIYTIWLAVPGIAFGFLQSLSGHKSPLYFYSLDFTDYSVVGAVVVAPLMALAAFVWAWFAGGATMLYHFRWYFGFPASIPSIRRLMIAWPLGMLAANFLFLWLGNTGGIYQEGPNW
jgi:hypothetical protein